MLIDDPRHRFESKKIKMKGPDKIAMFIYAYVLSFREIQNY